MICKIADFNIRFETDTKRTNEAFVEYKVNEEKYDISLPMTREDVVEFQGGDDEYIYKDSTIVCYHEKLAGILPLHNAIVFHSACFDIDGTGVAFTAHSGTGKTTHMNLWKKLLGNKMVIVNGDKPIVRFFDDEPEIPYAYGTPWNGKEKLGCNMRTPLKHICFIERSETNYVESIDKNDVIDRIMNQIYMPKDTTAMIKTIGLIDRLLSLCKLWIVHCSMDIEAAEIAYNTIFEIKE